MRVTRIVDLSLPLDASTQTHPGDPVVTFEPTETVATSGFNGHRLGFGSHTGTHCDAPFHIDPDGTTIDEVRLELFVGPAVVIDVGHRGAREPITVADVAASLDVLAPGVIPLVRTGWSRHAGTARAFDHPFLSPEACAALLGRGVRTVGIDTLSVDETPDSVHPAHGYPCHAQVLGSGGVLLENLSHLDRIDFPDPFLSALPLRLTGVDGSPVRAVAMQLGPAEEGRGSAPLVSGGPDGA